MDIEQQIQVLIDEAPDATVATAVTAVAPLLKQIAAQLKHQEYYVVQNLQQGWVITTLANRQQPSMAKKVVYAYGSLAAAASQGQDPQLMALPHPVTHLLFQLLALKPVDSLIFVEEGTGAQARGTEIKREDLAQFFQAQLRGGQIPPDIA